MIKNWNVQAETVVDLPEAERGRLQKLFDVYAMHAAKNAEKERYYNGKIPLSSVNLGLALPLNFSNFDINCEWGAKCVDVLAARTMFDGFVGPDGGPVEELYSIMTDNRMIAEYAKACRDELKYGCTFATLSADDVLGCRIRFHSPQTAAAIWDGELGRISCGFAIINAKMDPTGDYWTPTLINYYTDEAVWVLRADAGNVWHAEPHRHRMKRPLMVAFTWNATSQKPLGRSRLKAPIRGLIDSYVRTMANATIGLEFSTAPQKFLLGVTDEQYDALINQKFKQYVGNLLAATTNPETGEKPTFGQLQQGTISPHVEMMRLVATQFSAATGLSISDTGVVNDANPSSSEAILAQTQTLVGMAEELNTGNGDSLRMVAIMAMAIVQNKSIDELTDDEKAVIAHFKNPAMPSIAATADAALKIASSRQGFAQTDTFLEMIGFSQADIRRIKAQEQRVRGVQVLEDMGIEGIVGAAE